MEDLILQQFEKQNSKAGHILMQQNLNFGLFQGLNPKERELIDPAINNLIEKGLMTYEDGTNGPKRYKLTELGFESLYQNSKTIEQIEVLILKEFEKQNSKAGHILMQQNLNFGLFQGLNPKERELIDPAINNLIEKGFMTYEDGTNGFECYRLTDLGYQNLY